MSSVLYHLSCVHRKAQLSIQITTKPKTRAENTRGEQGNGKRSVMLSFTCARTHAHAHTHTHTHTHTHGVNEGADGRDRRMVETECGREKVMVVRPRDRERV